MRRIELNTLGLVVLGLVAVGASRANAQTVAPGPYYATPSWDQTLACTTLANCPRFIVLSNFSSQAVLDRETGLVWERSPSPDLGIWYLARFSCANRVIGGRSGWRLPSVHELASLIDPSASNPALPAGHPFTNIQLNNNFYWSASLFPALITQAAWAVSFNGNGQAGGLGIGASGTSGSDGVTWCVRGGGPLDAY